MIAWHAAQVGFARCISSRSRTVSPVSPSASLASFARSASTPGGGVGTAAPRTFSTIHAPRTTGDVRFGADVAVRMLPWPSSPRRGLSGGNCDAAQVAVAHAVDAVVRGEALVQIRVVGVEQLEHAAPLAQDLGEQELGLAAETPHASPRRDRDPATASRRARAASTTGRRSFRRSAARVRPSSSRSTCTASDVGLVQLAGRGDGEQLVVGDAAPQEERRAARRARGR